MVDTRARLSAAWAFVMLNMVFADILSFMSPGVLQQVLAGTADGIQITPGFLLVAAVVAEVPIGMVLLSRSCCRSGPRGGRTSPPPR